MRTKMVRGITTRLIRGLAMCSFIGLGGISASHAEIIHVDWTERAFAHASSIAPQKFLEVCARLKQGESIAWQFKGSAPTDFNLHFHVGKQVTYPQKRKGVATAAGTLAVPAD